MILRSFQHPQLPSRQPLNGMVDSPKGGLQVSQKAGDRDSLLILQGTSLRVQVNGSLNKLKVCDHVENDSCSDWVAQLVGVLSCAPKAVGSIPGQGVSRRQPIDVSLSHLSVFLSFSLSLPLFLPSCLSQINKHILG